MWRIPFADQQFYHLFNRGANKQPIFFAEEDYLRFVHDLYEMNDQNPTIDRRMPRGQSSVDSGGLSSPILREPIIDILAWCLMPNHFHLMVRQSVEGGITRFMRKLCTGYSMYINKKYSHSGHLFQGPFKSVPILGEPQFLHLSRYIHLNPADLIEPGWKERGVSNWGSVMQFLDEYRWSSYRDWIGKKNFPSILNLSGIEGIFKDSAAYQQFVAGWLVKNRKEISGLLFN